MDGEAPQIGPLSTPAPDASAPDQQAAGKMTLAEVYRDAGHRILAMGPNGTLYAVLDGVPTVSTLYASTDGGRCPSKATSA